MGLGGPSIDGGKITLNISGWWLKHMLVKLDPFPNPLVGFLLAGWWFFTNPFETYGQVKFGIHLPQIYRGEN